MMKKVGLIGSLALLIVYFFVLPSAAKSSLEGEWIGGLDFGSSWQYMNLHLKSEPKGVVGTVDLPDQGQMGITLTRIVVEQSHVHIEWQQGSGQAVLDGQVKDGAISGEFRQGETKATFGIVHVASIDPKFYDDYAGSYRLGADRFVFVGANNANELRFSDSKTGRIGTLYPSSETEFFLGSTVDIPYPIGGRVIFTKNNRGEVSGLTWHENGAGLISATRTPHHKESATFRNGAATLNGTLLLPPTKPPHAAVVIVNPGYSFPRRNAYFPYFFIQQGIAVLTLNGKSIDNRPADYQRSSFEERARDALAGVEFLKNRTDINAKRIGLHGASLSSWVVPLASTLSPDVAFVILRVGSAIPPADNIVYEIENDLRERSFSEDDITRATALRRLANTTILSNTGWDVLKEAVEKAKNEKWFGFARVGWLLSLSLPPDSATLKGLQDPINYDPVPVLEKVTVPVLAINAELDKNVNTKLSVPIMDRTLRKGGNKDFTIIVLPRTSHDLMEAETGYSSEWVRLKKQPPGYWSTMAGWLKKRLAT